MQSRLNVYLSRNEVVPGVLAYKRLSNFSCLFFHKFNTFPLVTFHLIPSPYSELLQNSAGFVKKQQILHSYNTILHHATPCLEYWLEPLIMNIFVCEQIVIP